jgi:hypothetical protein
MMLWQGKNTNNILTSFLANDKIDDKPAANNDIFDTCTDLFSNHVVNDYKSIFSPRGN